MKKFGLLSTLLVVGLLLAGCNKNNDIDGSALPNYNNYDFGDDNDNYGDDYGNDDYGNDNYGDDDLSYDEFRNFLLQETRETEVSFEVTDEEAESYGWKYLNDSECYELYGGIINKHPEKDSQGRNINCYNESGEEEGLHIFNGLSMFGYMDFDNYENGKRNGTHISIYPNGQKASKGTYIDGKINGDWTTYSKDGNVENVFHYKNGVKVKDMSSNS